MRILDITRNKIKLEDGREFNLTKNIIAKYFLKVEMELSEETLNCAFYDYGIYKSLQSLGRSDKSEKELFFYLTKHIPKEVASNVVDKMVELRYVDDFDYAKSYIENRKDGIIKLKFELKQRGISDEVLEKAILEAEFLDCDKIKYHLKKIKSREKDKKIRYLLNKGFEYDMILEEI